MRRVSLWAAPARNLDQMAPPLAGHFLGETHLCTALCQQWDAMEGKEASVREKDQVALVEVGESLSHLTRSGRIPKVGKETGNRWCVIGPGRSDLHPVSLSARRVPSRPWVLPIERYPSTGARSRAAPGTAARGGLSPSSSLCS
jgi:hypothetical protein